MIIVSDIKTITESSVTSEAAGYPLSNALDYKKPWLKWRSTDLSAQTITLPYSGSIDCVTILGANFEDITLFPVPIAHWKCNDDAANTTVTDDRGNYDGTSEVNTDTISSVWLYQFTHYYSFINPHERPLEYCVLD